MYEKEELMIDAYKEAKVMTKTIQSCLEIVEQWVFQSL